MMKMIIQSNKVVGLLLKSVAIACCVVSAGPPRGIGARAAARICGGIAHGGNGGGADGLSDPSRRTCAPTANEPRASVVMNLRASSSSVVKPL